MPARKQAKKQKANGAGRWSASVRTVSTYPPAGLFTKDAATIARVMATSRVSPKGPGSGVRMIQFFINRAGKGLPPSRRRELEKAKKLLRARMDRGTPPPRRRAGSKR